MFSINYTEVVRFPLGKNNPYGTHDVDISNQGPPLQKTVQKHS